MATENHFRQKSRLLRIMRLLRRFRPDLPVTYRRNRVLLFPGGHSFFRSLHTAVSGGPHHCRSYIRNAFLLNIASAAEEILIATPYFVPDPRIIRSLLRAVRRGVKVRLLLPARSDSPLVGLLGRSYYGAMLLKGIEIRELGWEILHAKVMLIDGERTVIGSANLDQRSFHRNYELNGVIDDVTFGRQIKNLLLNDFEKSRRVTVEGHERRGLIARFLEKVINLFDWFL